MTNSTTVSVIIPTYRRLDILMQCLQGVYAMDRQPDQVLVVYRPEDDRDTKQWLAEVAYPAFSTLQIVPVFKPGVVAALNAGIAVATSKIIAIFDDDAVPRSDWLSRILPHFAQADVAAAGGRDVVAGHPPVKETTMAGYIDFWGNIVGNLHIVVGEPRDVEVVKGCNWALRRAAIGSLQLDERLLGEGAQYANELLYCLNLRYHGWKIKLDPRAIVDHYPAIRLDHARNTWNKKVCHEQSCNLVATELAFYPWHLKLRYLLFHFLVGSRSCPGAYFILHSLLKRPRSLPGQLLGGWSGFFHGWQLAKEFKRNPPGLPNIPDSHKKEGRENGYVHYLLKHRIKQKPFTFPWCKIWAKRVINFKGLCQILWRNFCLSRKGVKIGYLSVIGNTHLQGNLANLVVGNECFIGSNVHLALHDKIIFGNNVVVNDGCQFLTASHDINCPDWNHVKAPIVIEDYVWIATNSMILPGVTIGKGSVVGAGSVVTKCIPPYQVVAGNPARIVKERSLKELSHVTVHWLAPFEAWLGIPKIQKQNH
jgi:acetyltransferase-like isoleucine patch superfamily enzyme/GT2 family glycosyltransferase